MNKLIAFLLSLLIGSQAYAQQVAIYQDTASPVVLYDTDGQRGPLAVNEYGYIIVGSIIPGTGATNLGKAEDSVAVSGDVGVLAIAVRKDSAGGVTTTNGDYSQISVNAAGAVLGDIQTTFQASNALGLLKLEDSAAASGDALVGVAQVVNESLTALAADGDYVAQAATRSGQAVVIEGYSPNVSSANQTAKLEDSAAASGDALVGVAGRIETTSTPSSPAADEDYSTFTLGQFGQALSTNIHDGAYGVNITTSTLEDGTAMASDGGAGIKILTQTQDPLTVDQGTNGDAAYLKVDRAGRTITTLAPAGETWQSCATSTASTADVALKGAVASNRIYVTWWGCKNTSATVGTTIDLKDAAGGSFAVGGVTSVQATAPGSFNQTFPVPLRGTFNQALNFAANVAVTSLTCCAGGYVSVH